MGWVRPSFGILIIFISLIYVLWEISPWVNRYMRRRPLMSLAAFIVLGACLGAGLWWFWENYFLPAKAISHQESSPNSPAHRLAQPSPKLDSVFDSTILDSQGFSGGRMTIERRIVVSLADIRTVSFQCDSCKYRVNMPPDNIVEIPHGCPYGHKWHHGEHETMRGKPLDYLFSGLAKLRLLTSQKATGFQILLEYDEPSAGQ